MAMAGQPREIKTTTEAWEEEPLNLGMLPILLYMLFSGEQDKGLEPLGPGPETDITDFLPQTPRTIGGGGYSQLMPTQIPSPGALQSGLPPTFGLSGLSPTDLLNLLLQAGG